MFLGARPACVRVPCCLAAFGRELEEKSEQAKQARHIQEKKKAGRYCEERKSQLQKSSRQQAAGSRQQEAGGRKQEAAAAGSSRGSGERRGQWPGSW